jgi:hypothetical protein
LLNVNACSQLLPVELLATGERNYKKQRIQGLRPGGMGVEWLLFSMSKRKFRLLSNLLAVSGVLRGHKSSSHVPVRGHPNVRFSMTQYRTICATLFLAALALHTLGCGSSNMNTNRVLQSMVITPANADAQTFPNGQVQFAATGTFNKAPSPAQITFQSPYTGTWSMMNAASASIATISQTGLAQCVPGASGTATVMAQVSANSAGGGQMSVAVKGTTTLTCP